MLCRRLVFAVAVIAVTARATTGQTLPTSMSDLARADRFEPPTAARLALVEARLRELESFQPQFDAVEGNAGRPPIAGGNSSRYFYGGYEHVFVKPYFSRNIAFWNESAGIQSQFSSFDWNTIYSPRVFVGYEAPGGTGIRGRFWLFDADASFVRTESPGDNLGIETNLADNGASIEAPGTLVGRHSIQAKVFDLEFTRHGDYRWGQLIASGGLRHATLKQSADWSETGGLGAIQLRHGFTGFGPTVAAEGSVPLFGSSLSFFAGGRTSLLFGNRSALLSDEVTLRDMIPDFDGLLPIVEAHVGLDWSSIVLGRKVVLRSALEGQSWFNGGGASGGDDEGMPANQIDMGFFGVSLTAIIELRGNGTARAAR